MEILTFILVLVVIYLLYRIKSDLLDRINMLSLQMTHLLGLLQKIEQQKNVPEVSAAPEVEESAPQDMPEHKISEPEMVKEEVFVEKEIITEPEALSVPEEEKEPVLAASSTKNALPPKPLPIEPKPSFFERYPDLEKFIGENLANKIGIAILVLSIGYFVKYAIDNNWIGPIGRVGIGILCGGVLIGFAHRMRNQYKAFSSVLVGGGLAIFYFTITLAHHQFHLFSQPVSFGILVVITVFAVILSLLYDRQELAVIAMVGGFASPFMVSTGQANYHALFVYLVILNSGLLVIAYYKSWRILNIAAFVLTVAVFSGVLYQLTAATYYIGLIYATIFYFLFFAINIAYNIRENKSFMASDFGILLANTALYFSVGLYLLTAMKYEEFRGLFSVSLGIINLVLSYLLFKNKKVDTNILYLLIGITLTFISLAAPIQLHGNYITLFWASETVLLYWLYLKSDIKLIRLASLAIWAAMLISLFMDCVAIYSYDLKLSIIANKGFITTVYAAVSSYLMYLLIKRDETLNKSEYKINIPSTVFQGVAVILLFLAGFLEVNHQFTYYYPESRLNSLYLLLYIPAFVFFLRLVWAKLKTNAASWKVQVGMLSVVILVYLLYSSSFFDTQQTMLETKNPSTMHFFAHWISDLFIAASFYQLIKILRTNTERDIQNGITWILCAGIIIFLSVEINLISIMLFYSTTYPIELIQTTYIKSGLPVLWGLSSFAMMWLGMRHKFRPLRIVSLSLFFITLLKLFLFDIRDISPAGKIAAFFCLGLLLLVISFMYQKVKKIIVADEEQSEV